MIATHEDVDAVYVNNHLESLLPLQRRFTFFPAPIYHAVSLVLLEAYAAGIKTLMDTMGIPAPEMSV